MMLMDDYQRTALLTERSDMTPRDRIGHGALGLAGEAGEAADLLKKHLHFDHPLDRDKVRAELGDVLWYVAVLADACGLTLDEVAEANMAKLRARYDGEWTQEASVERADDSADLRGLAAREVATEAVRAAGPRIHTAHHACDMCRAIPTAAHGGGWLCRDCLGAE